MRRARRDERGVSALELAVIAPSLLVLILLVVQVAFYLYGRSVALQAAREGVSRLRLEQTRADFTANQDVVDGDVVRFAKSIGSGGALNGTTVKSAYDDAKGRVTVTVTGHSISIVPFLGLEFDVSETSSGQIERFQDGN